MDWLHSDDHSLSIWEGRLLKPSKKEDNSYSHLCQEKAYNNMICQQKTPLGICGVVESKSRYLIFLELRRTTTDGRVSLSIAMIALPPSLLLCSCPRFPSPDLESFCETTPDFSFLHPHQSNLRVLVGEGVKN